MSRAIIVTGTDTGVGKTVFAAGLARMIGGAYWKPVQAGLTDETDSQKVARLAALPPTRILPEAWRLQLPASPHHAAKHEGTAIDPGALAIPESPYPLVIEGAGGVMVPLNETRTFLDVLAGWHLPVVLCASTRLGTINHTLLSLAALRSRKVPVLGMAFIGPPAPETQRIIARMGRIRILGRLPLLDPLNAASLHAAFRIAFQPAPFLSWTAA